MIMIVITVTIVKVIVIEIVIVIIKYIHLDNYNLGKKGFVKVVQLYSTSFYSLRKIVFSFPKYPCPLYSILGANRTITHTNTYV